jgi:Amt family ammonium transporter
LSFGDSIDSIGIIGDPLQYLNFKGVLSKSSNIPFLLFAIFQLKFDVITPALVSGSFAESIRFRSYILFMVLFYIFIYCPLTHMTWVSDGLFANFGNKLGWSGYEGLHVLDYAEGTVVHLSVGAAALSGAIFLEK